MKVEQENRQALYEAWELGATTDKDDVCPEHATQIFR